MYDALELGYLPAIFVSIHLISNIVMGKCAWLESYLKVDFYGILVKKLKLL